MNLTIEISLYPLTENYKEEVLGFINLLQQEGLKVRVNALSTQIQGDSGRVWNSLGTAIEKTFSAGLRASLVIKVLPGDIDLDYQYVAP
jgi:uncharacterized protein YqgV (UPF0045/DUF77 family)